MDIQALLTNEVFSGVLGGSLVVSAMYALKSVPMALWDFFTWRFTSELVVFNEDPAFDVVSDWLASLDYAKKARRLRLTSSYSDEEQRDVTQFSPGLGKHLLWHRGRPVLISRFVPDKGAGGISYKRREDICIRTIGTDPSMMHDLIGQIMAARLGATKKQVEVYMFAGYWRLACRKDKRSLASVVMPQRQRDGIVCDIETFLASRAWYAQRGIPYRRGMLFYGPPGCGKTSLVLALASHFSKKIYALNLGSVNGDEALIDAITSVPENAILLIEDIDAATASREVVTPVELVPGQKADPPKGITLSALLNAIDGVFSRDGRILIMTTNHPEKIDPALSRPGRADRGELIGELGPNEVVAMCAQFCAPHRATEVQAPIAPAELQKLLLADRSEFQEAAE